MHLSQTHPSLNELVDSHLTSGNALLIDAESLWQYPVSTNPDLYTSFGSRATNIVFNGVHEFDLVALLPYFKIAYQMTLRNVKVQICKHEEFTFPSTLRKFRAICSPCAAHALDLSSVPLECLYLEDDDNFFITPAPTIPTVTSLTTINIDVAYLSSAFPKLRSLTLDVWQRHKTYDRLQRLDRLEHLRILQCVDWTEQKVIDTLPIKSVEVSYNQRPTEEQNSILRLNDDCLYYLQRFLSPRDWILLKLAHSGGEHLRNPTFHVDIKYNDLYSNYKLETLLGFYDLLGPYASSLKTCRTIEPDLIRKVLQMFPNLKALHVPFYARTLASIPNGIERLVFEAKDEPLNATELFRRLNSTLNTLHIKYAPGDEDDFDEVHGLSELTNIREYHGRYLYLRRMSIDS